MNPLMIAVIATAFLTVFLFEVVGWVKEYFERKKHQRIMGYILMALDQEKKSPLD